MLKKESLEHIKPGEGEPTPVFHAPPNAHML